MFGSAVRSLDFDPGRSDVDFLVAFDTTESPPTLNTFFALRNELAAMLARPVDLVMAGSMINPYVKAEVERTCELVYAA